MNGFPRYTFLFLLSAHLGLHAQNDYLQKELKPVKDNFIRINSQKKWARIDTVELWESLEGGVMYVFYSDTGPEKLLTRNFGETFQNINEFYLANGKLSFVFKKSYKYNRPLFYDSLNMVKSGDDQFFDLEKSEVEEERNYL